jgi:hypothetical protein
LYGIGQGSCASPIIWALLNQLILATLCEKFDCIQLVYIEGTTHMGPGYSFVDDTTVGATNGDVTSLPVDAAEQGLTEEEEKLVAKMETMIQFFMDCLQVTGGDLAPNKCAWYLISHIGKDDIPRLLRPNPSHRGIEIVYKSTRTASGIMQHAPEEGHRTFVFHIAGEGTSTAHKKVMTDWAVLYGKSIVQSTLRRGESGMAYKSIHAKPGLRRTCDFAHPDRMHKSPKNRCQCNTAKDGYQPQIPACHCVWNIKIWWARA